ncbi:unnamed protein product [Acanthoscelides obtectus]|uniref:Farnesyl pyrophosphate synthase n=1 Tax=Acanthoscelides obtectus TaxID=200917 RepID=A0A9P0NVZ1_ACAOB|nr:unnamed protein product [Acanthoscelides obtectus]CAK1665787.1 Farnesyl pyrophosphate synthase [Acanthoscelides obtectus]
MFASERMFLNRTSREILRDLRRSISKTSSASNSEAISSRQDGRGTELKSDRHTKSKWIKLSRQNNIRALSTIQTKVKPPQAATPFFSKEESREFMAVFPDIVRDLTDAGRHTDIPEVTKRFAKVLQFNVPNGKKIRGLSTVISYKILEKPENLTPENIRLANVLGWCVEMLKSFDMIMDDVIDKSELRRNAPCWYKQEDVGLKAVADSLLLELSVYSVLKKYLSTHPMFTQLQQLFQDVSMKNAMGKSLETTITNGGNPDLKKFTMKNYNLIMKYRTGYYSFQLPVAAAMYLANKDDPEQHRQAKTILLEMGQFFHIQKDFMNCFGAPEVVGQVGSDINEGKCSWLAVVALQRASAAQRKIMEKHYGKPGQEAVDTIRDLYVTLGLPSTYTAYEEESYNFIHTHIQQISKGLPHELFFTLLDKLYAYE